MGLNLERKLKHQTLAVEAVLNSLEDIPFSRSSYAWKNPLLVKDRGQLKNNLEKVQNNNGISDTPINVDEHLINLDIKMETGTGKTYTYLKTIFELNRVKGVNKFIVIVPTVPIKLGTENFLKSSATRQHFKEEYQKDMLIHVLNSQSKKSKKRKKEYFPFEVSNFIRGTSLDNKIHILLVNMGMLNSKTMKKTFDDSSLFGLSDTPFALISEVNPVIIMDEPHKFSRKTISYKNILKFKPQLLLRYGATFPEVNGKKDYENLVYNLTAAKAFNEDLVKGVSVQIPKFREARNIIVKLIDTDKKEQKARFKLITDSNSRNFTLHLNSSLSIIDSDFQNLFILSIDKDEVILSNGMVLKKGNDLHPSSFTTTYQEILMTRAIDEHFEKEIEFFHRSAKIKPITLFFIDDISSYRPVDNKETYLKNRFEVLLKDKISGILANDSISEEYKEYLQESLTSIPSTHGGYFSKDNSVDDEVVNKQVKEILEDKESLISYKVNNEWNTRRFIFSKWTLKEGWDNPNVFTICKLRSSGSENSKLQEVGRGLRLPVNEYFNREKDASFELSYIVDFSEKEFAQSLVNEINKDATMTPLKKLSDEQLEFLGKEYNKTSDDIFDELRAAAIIDRKANILSGKLEELLTRYPVLTTSLKNNKIRTEDPTKVKKQVAVRISKYDEFKELWEKINQKVLINYKVGSEKEIEELINSVISTDSIIQESSIEITETKTIKAENKVELAVGQTKHYEYTEKLPYNMFLDIISKGTLIPLQTIHKSIVKRNRQLAINQERFFTRKTASNIVVKINEILSDNLLSRVVYQKVDMAVHPTALTDKYGKLVSVNSHLLGSKYSSEPTPENYLYEELYYDSNENEAIKEKIDSVIVFGKIPKSSIKIPVINGETYSPDFAYVVKNKNKSTQLHIVIESKNKSRGNLSKLETDKISLANKFFDTINDSGVKVVFETQLKNDSITGIIKKFVE